MSDCRHPYTPMKQTRYGYVSKEEYRIDKQLDKDLKKRLRKEGAFNLHKKEKKHERSQRS
ncbi:MULTISPECIES: hypothetical protein [Lentilactobacillus]|uniref:hypothetical protein n=1 Tax=Lentilactobacillus TaxID=2767893 RepID=UPI000A113665|nr:hypothetical protein [Lentilactobacillus buchneri]ORN12713.1 hypothetical protein FAM23164_02341 [Lentilactobacillus parabuchneri]MQN23673.1 hypothetical protein [Lentilactobacillus buchneri]ORN14603.1 hypothetical protein FAM23165_02349 [Lentilactobacillus parabuchneri]ORN17518.1 hypothetical protein FAM23166_02329 [Lentilactobacillus parabuchneri]ORN23900.1 hypothetical protein FAM23167_02114 [Lentilactobacillus parabuchneri]